MLSKRPSIFVYTNNANPDILREICAGIEEEGLFAEIYPKVQKDINAMAWQAANDSMMGVGIGIYEQQVALQMKGLEQGKNVMELQIESATKSRIIGSNSVRLIKRMPLREEFA